MVGYWTNVSGFKRICCCVIHARDDVSTSNVFIKGYKHFKVLITQKRFELWCLDKMMGGIIIRPLLCCIVYYIFLHIQKNYIHMNLFTS